MKTFCLVLLLTLIFSSVLRFMKHALRCSQINEVQKFSIIVNISNQVSPRSFSNSVPPRSVYTENPIIVSTTANYIQVVEEVLIVILQGEVENDVSNCYPFVTVIHIHFYHFDPHFIMYYLQS